MDRATSVERLMILGYTPKAAIMTRRKRLANYSAKMAGTLRSRQRCRVVITHKTTLQQVGHQVILNARVRGISCVGLSNTGIVYRIGDLL